MAFGNLARASQAMKKHDLQEFLAVGWEKKFIFQEYKATDRMAAI
jgi:hypothetical protein